MEMLYIIVTILSCSLGMLLWRYKRKQEKQVKEIYTKYTQREEAWKNNWEKMRDEMQRRMQGHTVSQMYLLRMDADYDDFAAAFCDEEEMFYLYHSSGQMSQLPYGDFRASDGLERMQSRFRLEIPLVYQLDENGEILCISVDEGEERFFKKIESS